MEAPATKMLPFRRIGSECGKGLAVVYDGLKSNHFDERIER
jgi:hypothetical protein